VMVFWSIDDYSILRWRYSESRFNSLTKKG
jgi:hypothetical protein